MKTLEKSIQILGVMYVTPEDSRDVMNNVTRKCPSLFQSDVLSILKISAVNNITFAVTAMSGQCNVTQYLARYVYVTSKQFKISYEVFYRKKSLNIMGYWLNILKYAGLRSLSEDPGGYILRYSVNNILITYNHLTQHTFLSITFMLNYYALQSNKNQIKSSHRMCACMWNICAMPV